MFVMQAAEEFTMQARSTERRWSRALQHEHSLRLQLQENMEALANQMHGLEDEARLTVQGGTVSSHGNITADTISTTTTSDLSTEKKTIPTTPALYKSFTETIDGDTDSDEDDKFFDAPEASATDWSKPKAIEAVSVSPSKQQAVPGVSHRRSFSTASVNDSSSMMSTASDANIREQFPQISSDRRMAVSVCMTLWQ